jgi:hypothetical protein
MIFALKMSGVAYDDSSGVYSFQCPHCQLFVEVGRNEINCRIFRHGYFFSKTPDGRIILIAQMNPHESEQECDRLSRSGLIYGCGKPFRLTQVNGEWTVEPCGYI